jgi:hypothetical protein
MSPNITVYLGYNASHAHRAEQQRRAETPIRIAKLRR